MLLIDIIYSMFMHIVFNYVLNIICHEMCLIYMIVEETFLKSVYFLKLNVSKELINHVNHK